MIASLALSESEIKKLVEFAGDPAQQDSAALATIQKLAGKLAFTQTAIAGRIGRAALKPIFELIAKGSGATPRNVEDCLGRWSSVLPAVALRFILSLRQKEPVDSVRINSDAAGAGKLAGVSFFSNNAGRRPALLISQTHEKLQALAATSNKIYISELFPVIAAVSQPRARLWRRRVILFVDDDAACAASA